MPTISSVLSSNFFMIPTLKGLRGGAINNTTSIHNFGDNFLRSPTTRLCVKIDNNRDPSKINEFNKTLDQQEIAKKMYAYDDYVVSQRFLVRLYELDIHQKASLEALLNYTEETGLNLFQSSGLVVGGYAVSKEMSSRNLIWVIGKMQVALESYPSWGDIVQVETWCSALGKHSLTCSSRLTNSKTGKKIMRVDSEFMMINEKTRRLSKLPEEIKTRGEPYVRQYFDPLLINDKHDKLRKLNSFNQDEADYIVKGIRPLWIDLDPNQHVNNIKYISWILEGTLESVRANCELAAISLEYRRECGRDSVLHSLSRASNTSLLEFDHTLCLGNGNEVARARTLWRPKDMYNPIFPCSSP